MLDALRTRAAVLRHGPVRRLLVGHAVSVLGDGFYWVAAMWFVYDLTGSTVYTGLAGFLARAPGVGKVLVGPLVDRWTLGRTLVLSEAVQAAVVLLVPLLAAFGHLDVGAVLAVVFLLAVTNLFAGPAQQATLARVVDGPLLVRANAAITTAAQTARAAARAAAGVVVAAAGAVALFALDAATFVVGAGLFATVAVPAREDPAATATFDREVYVAELREGVAVLTGSVLGQMVVAVLFANFLLGAATAVLPAFAAATGGAETYGLLLAGMTAGSVLGSAGASLVDRVPLGRTTVVGFVVAGALWTAAVVVEGAAATVALFTLSQVPVGVYTVGVKATLQSGVPDDLLGRVTATVGSGTSLAGPVGLLVGGLLGARFAPSSVMVLGGVGVTATALY